MNIADEATKWGSGPNLDPHSSWFRGPEFLLLTESQWPKIKPVLEDPVEELRAVHIHREISVQPFIDPLRFSCLKDLLRKLAYIYHFLNRCRSKGKPKVKSRSVILNQQDYAMAENSLWRMVQAEAFPDELAVLRANLDLPKEQRKRLEKHSCLSKLSPFLDVNEVLRSESRIDPQAAYYCFDFRNPVILPKRNHVTEMLILRFHQRFGHANYEAIINEIQQKYYIVKLRSEVKRVIKNCMWCRVYRAKPLVPRMAPLPQERVQPYVRPFTFTGIDYFGPLVVKMGRSNVKRWVALFTCLTVRAVHLEVVNSLSAESCKMAIRRFVARRGSPQQIFSDNGTNFKGVARELADEIKTINLKIAGTFTNANTEWHFIPPSAPHMGGVWERKVRSIKEAFKVLSHREKLDDEGLVTLLTEAELLVNSHPLTCVPLETHDQNVLTPNSFLLMSSSEVNHLNRVPTEGTSSLRTNWKLMQHLLNQFWKRWITCYLPTIARRTKWFTEVPPIKEGDLVVVVDESVRNGWLRGRVVKTYHGIDDQVRKADIETSSGILQRPATKVALLDVLEISKTN
ncbi:uncharacterized protein LOC129731329 [Wyeomyia smithii]|uniref:uncharacterized protein LOC129731329 n=1 Tax=Wyeomyia smithii TaxID=174621 RepID=UPI002467D6F5|nr:uncharacterized protein LOC129731329 [Wyeomyia smithii]